MPELSPSGFGGLCSLWGVCVRVIVVTGSRLWSARGPIEAALAGAELLVVGDCPMRVLDSDPERLPRSADAIAIELARAWDIITAVHVADWKTHGKKAGAIRNHAIVQRAVEERAAGMDVACHAFFTAESRGTAHCAKALERAGFSVVKHA